MLGAAVFCFRKEVYQLGLTRFGLQVTLLELGIALHYAAAAHTEHRLPDSRAEAVKLRWMRGQDSVGLTPYLVQAYLPARLHWFARSGPLAPLCILFARLRHFRRCGILPVPSTVTSIPVT